MEGPDASRGGPEGTARSHADVVVGWEEEVYAPAALAILHGYYWFCGRSNRELIQLATADLCDDVKAMRTEGRSALFINSVVFWHVTTGTLVPIGCDTARRIARGVSKMSGLARLIEQIVTHG